MAEAQQALAHQDYQNALRLCGLARQQGVRPSDVLCVQSDIFKAADYLDTEIDTLRRWCRAAPKNTEPWFRLFYIYLDLGWMREAQQASDHILQLAPRSARAHITRALYFYRSDTPLRGIPAIQRARQLAPDNIPYINLHATLLLRVPDYVQAEAAARQAVTRDPSIANRLLLAAALIGQHKNDEARAIYQEVLKQEPNEMEAAYELGILAQKQGDAQGARHYFEQVAQQDGGYNKTAWYLGNLYRTQGRTAEGSKMLQFYQSLNANDGEFETALKRLRSRPDDKRLHAHLAQMHTDADELPQAIVEWQRVQQLQPSDTQAKVALAEVLRRHGRIGEAQRLSASIGRR